MSMTVALLVLLLLLLLLLVDWAAPAVTGGDRRAPRERRAVFSIDHVSSQLDIANTALRKYIAAVTCRELQGDDDESAFTCSCEASCLTLILMRTGPSPALLRGPGDALGSSRLDVAVQVSGNSSASASDAIILIDSSKSMANLTAALQAADPAGSFNWSSLLSPSVPSSSSSSSSLSTVITVTPSPSRLPSSSSAASPAGQRSSKTGAITVILCLWLACSGVCFAAIARDGRAYTAKDTEELSAKMRLHKARGSMLPFLHRAAAAYE